MIYLLRRRGLGNISCAGIATHSRTGLAVYRNDRTLPEADLVFRWGCTSNVPTENVVNTSKAIHAVSDKMEFRRALNNAELCPKTWFNAADVVFPAIVRPRFHSQGRQLFIVNDPTQLLDAIRECGQGWYASAIIPKVAEYRVYVAQGRAIGVSQKQPRDADAIAWNMAQGGTCSVTRWNDWPLKAVKNAIKAQLLSGLDFGAVDTILDAEGNDYILEINTAPTISPYRQQGFAKVFDYIVEHGKDTIPLIEAKGGYRKFIHPAVCTEALL